MEEKVLKIIIEIVGHSVEPTDSLIQGGILKSLDFISVIVRLEKTFHVKFDDNDYLSGNLESAKAISTCIEKKLKVDDK